MHTVFKQKRITRGKQMIDKKALAGAIYNNPVAVKFVKADGSVRVMICTLSQSLVPSTELTRVSKVDPNQEYLRVWDLEKQEWRSFNFRTVQEYKVLEKVSV